MERIVKADQSLSYVVLSAVAEVEGCCPTELPRLHDTLDADALDALFDPRADKTSKFEGTLTFEYSDCSVSIWCDQYVTVSIPT